MFANSFRTIHPAAGATGLRTFEFQHDSLYDPSVPRTSEDFLINSRLVRADLEFGLSVGTYFREGGSILEGLVGVNSESVLALPGPTDLPMRLTSAIERRRSSRAYTGDPMRLDQLSAILWASAGTTKAGSKGCSNSGPRTTASAGALYPVTFWIVALNIKGLERAVYAYDPIQHSLVVMAHAEAVSAVLGSIATPDEMIMISRACLVGFFVARPWRSMRKYGARGMRHVFIEAGAMAAHCHLACAALGFGSVDCSSVYDDELHEALGVDGLHEGLTHTVVVGSIDA